MNKRMLPLVLGGILIIVVFLGIIFYLQQTGSAYTRRLSTIAPKQQDPPQTREKKRVRRITVQEEEGGGCIEVTPDGIVRSFSTCGGEPVDTNRLADPKNIFKLIELASIIDTRNFKIKPLGKSIMLVIESDQGIETIYIAVRGGGNGGGGSGGGGIVEIIDLIKGDLPQPTATPAPTAQPTPTLPGTTPLPTNTPTPTFVPGQSPFPTPTGPKIPFSCGFTEGGQKKPFTVSNVICSTGPTPPP